jgi:D-alanyl-D-alanine carboxypeptidase
MEPARRGAQRTILGSAGLWGLCAGVLTGLAASSGAAQAAPLPDLAAAARSILGAGQGVYVESADGTVLLAQAATRAVHPASVSKIPTTLALLRKFGPDYRFTTTLTAHGRIVGGTLEGNLLVRGDGDPALVDEDAAMLSARLNELGIHRIAGALRPEGSWTFDWQSDPTGVRLARALAGLISPAAWSAVQTLQGVVQTPATADGPPHIEFLPAAASAVPTASASTDGPTSDGLTLAFRSEPLLSMLKALNDYSNNIMAALADEAGGAAAVQSLARSVVPAGMRSQIILGDGAGENPRNRLSPRAAVTLLRALEMQLATTGHTLCDVLPVAGIDAGTLHDRLNGPTEAGRVVGKTGTYGSYGASALIGAIPTTDRGTVYFAILDHGVPVPEARRRQDRFVRVLLAHLHTRPWAYRPDARPAVALALLSPPPQTGPPPR